MSKRSRSKREETATGLGAMPSTISASYAASHSPLLTAFDRFASSITRWAGTPTAFCGALLVILSWAITGPLFGFSENWQLVINTGTTIVTFLMVFLIQNSQNRDAAAIQAKLDELIRAVDKARGQFIGIEHLTDTQIERIRAALEREEAASESGKESVAKDNTAEDSVERLLERR